jgi:hypothetical protein
MANTDAENQPKNSYPVTWEEIKDAELDDALRATPAQRLAWLEAAVKLAWEAKAKCGVEV